MPTTKKTPIRVIEEIKNTYWHMLPSNVETIIDIVNRENDFEKYKSLLTKEGEPLENTLKATNRGGVALLPINGPIFPKANLFTEVSGATSLETLARDFVSALENPEIKAIIFEIDSPGGSVKGLSEFSDLVFNARGKKPIVSFVTATAASAAFFIGSAADKMIIAREAMVGAIGTIVNIEDTSGQDKKMGIVERRFTSKISPKKNLPISSKEGQSQIQNIVDKLGEIFVQAVARNRGVSEETVLNDFGQGDILIGESALKAGMVDSIGTLENTITTLSKQEPFKPKQNFNNEGIEMNPEDIKKLTFADIQNHNPELFKSIVDSAKIEDAKAEAKADGIKAGIAQENDRIKGVEEIKSPSNSNLVDELKFDSSLSKGDIALKVLAKQNEIDKGKGDEIVSDAENLSDKTKALENAEQSEETKKTEHKNLVTNITKGANESRPKNMGSLDKVQMKDKEN